MVIGDIYTPSCWSASSSSSSIDSSPHSPSPFLFVTGQILRTALTDVDRAREEALAAGNIRELAALRRRHRRRRAERSIDHGDVDSTTIPAPAHIILTPNGEQEIYQPDRENHIRIPGRRHSYRAGHPHAGSIKVPRPRKGHGSRTRPGPGPGLRSTAATPAEQIGGAKPTQTTTTSAAGNGANAVASQSQSSNGRRGGRGAGGAREQRLKGRMTLNGQTTPPPSSSSPPIDSSSSDGVPLSDGSGRLFTPEELANLSSMDDGLEEESQASSYSRRQSGGGGGGYLSTVVDAIIDPHSVVAHPNQDAAKGVLVMVLIPISIGVFLFCAYSIYIYQKRVALEGRQADHARKRKAKGTGGVRDGLIDSSGSTKSINAPATTAPPAGSNNNAQHQDEDDWDTNISSNHASSSNTRTRLAGDDDEDDL